AGAVVCAAVMLLSGWSRQHESMISWRLAVLLWMVCAIPCMAQPVTVKLPISSCRGRDSLFADGFEADAVYVSDPSMGVGGAWPGKSTRQSYGSNFGVQTYYVYVPPAYDAAHPMTLMVVLHGAAGSHALAMQAAQGVRDNWISAADAYGFII